MSLLRLVPLYLAEQEALVAPVARHLEHQLPLSVRLHRAGFDPEGAFEPERGQYSSRLLLVALLRDTPAEDRVLGLTDVDLFVPVLSYVFGEAQLQGRAAIVSCHRLRAEAYGLAADRALLLSRLCKEATHEVGHTFGLLHCHRDRCVMQRATYVEEIDLKGDGFCPACRRQLGRG